MKPGRPTHAAAQKILRRYLIIFFRECGESYAQIGDRFDLRRQSVGAILKAQRPDLCGKIRPN